MARVCVVMVLVALVALAVGACGPKNEYNIAGPSKNGVQTIAIHGPAVNVEDSPCAGNINAGGTGAAAEGDDNRDNPTASTGTNTPDCSETAPPAFPPVAP